MPLLAHEKLRLYGALAFEAAASPAAGGDRKPISPSGAAMTMQAARCAPAASVAAFEGNALAGRPSAPHTDASAPPERSYRDRHQVDPPRRVDQR